jgi:CRISPR/Cas system CMR-associated protein Cmr1 (group 7 of RAMP superfamily)
VKERGKPPSGKDYLFWSMAETGSREKGNFQPARKFIEEGFPFSVVLSTQKFGSEADYTLRHAVYSLWLAVHLGGFGSRSRRMAGSLSPLRVQSIDGLTFGLTKSDPKEIAEELSANLRIIRQSLIQDLRDETNLSGVPSFDILNPAYCKIWVLGKALKADVELNFVGHMLQEFRNQVETSASRVFQWLRGQNIEPIERVQFGLPIVYRFVKKENNQSKVIANGTVIAGMKKGDQIEKIERRASPLWISALRSPDNQVIVTATFFNSQFLPRGADLMMDKRKDLPLINPPDVSSSENSPIMKWIKQKFPKAVEVDYA